MGILSFIFGSNRSLPKKDVYDYTLTKSSSDWQVQQHWCKRCKTDRSHREYMSRVCSGCGGYSTISLYGCSIRSIWNGEKWIKQYRECGLEWTEEKTQEIINKNIEREKAQQELRNYLQGKS